jgi:hypothetical protein
METLITILFRLTTALRENFYISRVILHIVVRITTNRGLCSLLSLLRIGIKCSLLKFCHIDFQQFLLKDVYGVHSDKSVYVLYKPGFIMNVSEN